jgi:hypothetical protein
MRLLLTMMSPFGRRKEVTMLIGMASMRDFDVVGVEGLRGGGFVVTY